MDAFRISDACAEGKTRAMEKALKDADITAYQIDYINAHGTATPLNDSMESKALHSLGFSATPVSSTKCLTGHTLGAAGAIAIALPGPRWLVPGATDALWLDGGSMAFLAFGVLGPTPLTRTLPWSGGFVAGTRTVWQGASLDATGLQISNPSVLILP